MTIAIRRAATVGEGTWWLNSLLCHAAAPDDALPHLGSASVQLGAHQAPQTWTLAIAWLRVRMVNRVALRLVEPGDPLGLSGPPEVLRQAVAAGAAIVGGDGAVTLVPLPDANRWVAYETSPRPGDDAALGTLGESRRLMRESMAELTAALPGLEPDDAAQAQIAQLRAFLGPHPAPAVEPRAAQLAGDALRVWWLTIIATELADRREVAVPEGLRELRPLARRAASVAFSEPVAVRRLRTG